MSRLSSGAGIAARILQVAAGCALIAGCRGLPVGLRPGAANSSAAAARHKLGSLALNWPADQAAHLRAADVGVVVFEPIARGVDPQLAAFGTGCTRWLQFVVGGQPDLAQTPTWTTIDRARRELKSDDLRLGLDDTAPVAQKTGASHCVVGEIAGTPDSAVLTLAVAQPDGRKLIGSPIVTRGSRDQILAALPGLASQIARRLGVAAPAVPAGTACSADDLQFVGGLPWLPPRDSSQQVRTRLDELARKTPFAALPALACSDLTDAPHADGLARDLVSGAPNNAAAFGGLAYLYAHGCARATRATTSSASRRSCGFAARARGQSWTPLMR
jgi:hypothetical protein